MKKFMPMGLMMFFILFNYTILRDMKDTLLVNAAGAEAIPYIKFWCVMPASILFVLVYSKMANRLAREVLFYAVLTPFLLFFGLFAFAIYPSGDLLHPSKDFVAELKHAVPFLRFVFAIFGKWTLATFYVMAELWGSVVITLLFWQFANEITRTREAKRFYPLFPLIGNLGLLLSGPLLMVLAKMSKKYPFALTMKYVMGVFLVFGVLTMLVYWWMNRKVLTDPFYYDGANAEKQKKQDKPKLSLKESLGYITRSRYLGFITIVVLGYGVCINLVEVTWKSQLKLKYPDEHDYLAFMGLFSTCTAIATITLIFLCKGLVRRYGWFRGAVATPLMLLGTGLLFFAFVIFRDQFSWLTVAIGIAPVMMAVIIGAAQNILSKGTKYSLFDPTTQMAYIPLDQELKVKGKAAVDVIGGRMGKAGGSLIQQGLLGMSATATMVSVAPVTCSIMVVLLLVWIWAVAGLGKMYNEKIRTQEPALGEIEARKTQPVETAEKEEAPAAQ